MVVMDDEHNEIDQADLDQFAAETIAEIDKTAVANHEEAAGRAQPGSRNRTRRANHPRSRNGEIGHERASWPSIRP